MGLSCSSDQGGLPQEHYVSGTALPQQRQGNSRGPSDGGHKPTGGGPTSRGMASAHVPPALETRADGSAAVAVLPQAVGRGTGWPFDCSGPRAHTPGPATPSHPLRRGPWPWGRASSPPRLALSGDWGARPPPPRPGLSWPRPPRRQQRALRGPPSPPPPPIGQAVGPAPLGAPRGTETGS